MDLPNFSMHSPSGEGWLVTQPDKSAAQLQFENRALNAGIIVDDGRLGGPVSNVREKLLNLSQAMEKRFSQHGKLILSERSIDSRPGAQCLYQRIIINSPEVAMPGLPSNTAVHSLACIYDADHRRMATFSYMYPTQGTADEQKKVAQAFFAGISFKQTPAK